VFDPDVYVSGQKARRESNLFAIVDEAPERSAGAWQLGRVETFDRFASIKLEKRPARFLSHVLKSPAFSVPHVIYY
jgi:hypothetical protein